MTGRLVLVRHGQSHGNVDRRLDTRPPGAALTDLGHEQARTFGRALEHPVGLIAHSMALRAVETAAEIGEHLGLTTVELDGIHEVQVGDLENRNDDDADRGVQRHLPAWQEGDLDVPMPGGESAQQVLDRYLPVVTQLRLRYLDDHAWKGDVVVVSHGAAIRLVGAALVGRRRRLRPRAPPRQHRVRGAEPDHRRPVELRAVGTAARRRSSRSSIPVEDAAARRRPDGLTVSSATPRSRRSTTAQAQPMASQSMLKACGPSGVAQSSVHSTPNEAWCTTVPWQCSRSVAALATDIGHASVRSTARRRIAGTLHAR